VYKRQIYGNAKISGDALISGNAKISGDADIFWISKIGSSNRTTTFFKSKGDKIKVKCGCFYGDIFDFEKK
jgi:hypothetical protein